MYKYIYGENEQKKMNSFTEIIGCEIAYHSIFVPPIVFFLIPLALSSILLVFWSRFSGDLCLPFPLALKQTNKSKASKLEHNPNERIDERRSVETNFHLFAPPDG